MKNARREKKSTIQGKTISNSRRDNRTDKHEDQKGGKKNSERKGRGQNTEETTQSKVRNGKTEEQITKVMMTTRKAKDDKQSKKKR